MSTQRNYGRKGSTPFDRLINQQCQKGVSASKSAGVVGRWGMTSFTSLRNGGDSSRVSSTAGGGAGEPPKKKKFFKSRNVEPIGQNEKEYSTMEEPMEQEPRKRKKFFTSKNAGTFLPKERFVTNPDENVEKERRSLTPEEKPDEEQEEEEEEDCNDYKPQSPSPLPPTEPPKVPPLKLKLSSSSSSSSKALETNVTNVTNQYKLVHSFSGSEESSRDSIKSTEEEEERINESSTSTPHTTSPPRSPISHPPLTCSPVPTFSPPTQVVEGEIQKSNESSVEEGENKSRTLNTYGSRSRRCRPGSENVLSKEVIIDKEIKTDEEDGKKDEERLLNNNIVPDSKVTSVIPSYCPEPTITSQTSDTTTTSTSTVLTKATSVASSIDVQREVKITNKRSIFKSKDKTSRSKAQYKHQWNTNSQDDFFKQEVLSKAANIGKNIIGDNDDYAMNDDGEDFIPSKLIRVTKTRSDCTIDGRIGGGRIDDDDDEDHDSLKNSKITSVKCSKAQKSYFTVIKNVKKAHQIQDSGEFQEFNDDVEYIMGGLGASHSLSTRCLSTITLASKCMEPPFRMHLRAHGTVTKFFGEIKDAPENSSLALCAATVLFVLSQDRLNMDLDRNSLGLMLNLLDTDSRIKDALDESGMDERELIKNKEKVRDLCAAMKAKGHAKNLSLDNISADHLAMETLLSLTSKRAGEWFKEELRQLGGLDHLVYTLSECVNYLKADDISMWTDPLLTKLRKASRVLKVMENVTHDNEENCLYLLRYENGKCFDLMHSFLKLVDEEVPLHPYEDSNDKESTAFTLCQSLMDVIRVYINLVHDYQTIPMGSKMGGEKEDLFEIALHCLFVIPNYVPENKTFDILVLCLTLLINLVENCESNRLKLLTITIPVLNSEDSLLPSSSRRSGVEGLVSLFMEKENSAKNEESKTDNILDGVKDEDEEEDNDNLKKSREEVIDETVAKLLHKAGRHMEDTLIASYITLIIGYLIFENKDNEKIVRDLLPEHNFMLMVSILKKFFNFMNLTASSTIASSRGIKATEKIIKYLEKIDKVEDDEPQIKKEESFDDFTLFDISKDESSLVEESHDSSFEDFGKI